MTDACREVNTKHFQIKSSHGGQTPADISNQIKNDNLSMPKLTFYQTVLSLNGVSPLWSYKRYMKDDQYDK